MLISHSISAYLRNNTGYVIYQNRVTSDDIDPYYCYGLQNMLDIYSAYGIECDIRFNQPKAC